MRGPGRPSRAPGGLLKVGLQKPESLPTSIIPNTDTIKYYELFRSYGYPGSFTDFINETVKAYMIKEGLHIGLIIEKEE